MAKPVFKRVVLKVSGEALQGRLGYGIDYDVTASIAKAFGSTGGIAMLGSQRHYDFLYRTGPLGWSQSLRTAAIGTTLGSIKVHRSPELRRRQDQLPVQTVRFPVIDNQEGNPADLPGMGHDVFQHPHGGNHPHAHRF